MNLLNVCKLKTAKYIHSWPSSTSGPSNDILDVKIRIGSPRVLSHFTQIFISRRCQTEDINEAKFYVVHERKRNTCSDQNVKWILCFL